MLVDPRDDIARLDDAVQGTQRRDSLDQDPCLVTHREVVTHRVALQPPALDPEL